MDHWANESSGSWSPFDADSAGDIEVETPSHLGSGATDIFVSPFSDEGDDHVDSLAQEIYFAERDSVPYPESTSENVVSSTIDLDTTSDLFEPVELQNESNQVSQLVVEPESMQVRDLGNFLLSVYVGLIWIW